MRRRKRERAYQDVLDSIARLEYELGLTDVPPPRRSGRIRTPADAARLWAEAVNAKAANYVDGLSAVGIRPEWGHLLHDVGGAGRDEGAFGKR